MNILFSVYGLPVAKGRPRMTKSGHTYTPQKTRNHEDLVKLSYIQNYGTLILEKPLAVMIVFYMPIPKSASNSQRLKMLRGEVKPTKRPDIDNLAKTVLDGLNGVAYKDDNQIVELKLQKKYGENPRTQVFITECSF